MTLMAIRYFAEAVDEFLSIAAAFEVMSDAVAVDQVLHSSTRGRPARGGAVQLRSEGVRGELRGCCRVELDAPHRSVERTSAKT
ncbi:MAG: hypothetical protein H0V51_08015 [Chloroflexi bacterium]|nr:hypothetical protein [Chloroflexota bacterium]